MFNGEDGRLSIRRCSSLIFLSLIVKMVVSEYVVTQYALYALYSLETTFLLLIGIITVDNIIRFWKGDSKKEA